MKSTWREVGLPARDGENSEDVVASAPAIRLRSASRDYGGPGRRVRALDRVDLVVPRGQVVSLLGPSGSGKSTLLRIAAGIEPPTRGAVEVLGADLASLPDARRCALRLRKIGQVFQGGRLLPGVDVLENVAFPLSFLGVPRVPCLARAAALLERVGVARTARSRFPSALPAADRPRVAIARALVAGPEILLADEPTASLDSAASRSLLDLLASLAAESDLTMVVATHATEAATLGQRTLVLRDGRIVRDVSALPRGSATVRPLRTATA